MDENYQPQGFEQTQTFENDSNTKQNDKSGIDVAVLLMGIFSFIIPLLGWLLSIAGIITYFFSSKTTGKAILGLICSVTSRILAILIIVFLLPGIIEDLNEFEKTANKEKDKIKLTGSFKGDPLRMSVDLETNQVQFVVKFIGVGSNVINKLEDVSLDSNAVCSLQSMTDPLGEVISSDNFEAVSFVNGQESVFTFKCDEIDKDNYFEGDIKISYSDSRTPSLKLQSTGTILINLK